MPRESVALGEFEQIVLLGVMQAGAEAYGITVHAELTARTSRRVSLSAVYLTLDRLENKGLLRSWLVEPTGARGGRARRCYGVTKNAVDALKTSRRDLVRLWHGLNELG
jgi:DNA-binding PadR family transcriptional regulator